MVANRGLADAAEPIKYLKRFQIGRVSSAVEQRFCKPQVVGSNPTPGTNLINHLADILWMIVVRSSSLGNTLGNILPWCIAGRQALRTVMRRFRCAQVSTT
jgi:hypothetical protein